MAKIVVDVMLKPEIHDPQGEAIAGACHRLGFTEVVSVRQGKRFVVEIADSQEAPEDNAQADAGELRTPVTGAEHSLRVAEIASELLANPVIEEFAIHVP